MITIKCNKKLQEKIYLKKRSEYVLSGIYLLLLFFCVGDDDHELQPHNSNNDMADIGHLKYKYSSISLCCG